MKKIGQAIKYHPIIFVGVPLGKKILVFSLIVSSILTLFSAFLFLIGIISDFRKKPIVTISKYEIWAIVQTGPP